MKPAAASSPDAALRRGTVALCALLAAANLLQGLGGGLARLGWGGVGSGALGLHGAVMVCGFFGTLISLERAVALRHGLGYAVPLLAALGGVAAWGPGAASLALGLWALASAGLVGLYLWAGHTRAWSLHLGVEALGAACWGLGVAAWALNDAEAALRAWMAFLVLTIAGERRELMQMRRLPRGVRVGFIVVVGVALAAVLLGLMEALAGTAGRTAATVLWWVACAALALWLLRWDFAPRQWAAPQWPGHRVVRTGHGHRPVGRAKYLNRSPNPSRPELRVPGESTPRGWKAKRWAPPPKATGCSRHDSSCCCPVASLMPCMRAPIVRCGSPCGWAAISVAATAGPAHRACSSG